jgi:hypothetical protein
VDFCPHVSPLVIATNLVLFLRGKVILDVKGLADLFGRLALDHVCDSLATDIEKSLDVKVVSSRENCQQWNITSVTVSSYGNYL